MIQRYRIIKTIGQGSMGVVYHAYDRLTQQEVALKQVVRHHTINMEDNIARLSLIREFQTLASLKHPNIIDVLDFGFTEDQTPYFTMQLLSNTRTIQEAIIGTTLDEGMALIIQVLQALSYLHRQGIVHRDLKPTNVLVLPDNTVKLLDFGLATSVRGLDEVTAGTLAYMSPELLLGQPATRASDLFAVGVIMYELLAGKHPFQGKTISEMVTNILTKAPDLTPLTSGQWMLNVRLPDAIEDRTVILNENYTPLESMPKQLPIEIQDSLALVIHQLLVKNPKDRDFDAYKVIDSLCEAVGIEPPIESEAVRQSVLRGARFVGRQAELQQFEEALKKTFFNQGSAWLIGGEAGVGKSRLVDEVRIRALVSGLQVLRGQAAENGAHPFKIWRDILPKLLLDTLITDEEAGILYHILPSIGSILERSVQPAPQTQNLSQQLHDTIVTLFKRITKPTLLILEDVHWAQDCLDPIKTLAHQVAEMPLLIIATYRSDDAPYFYGQLYTMQQMNLDRLNEAELRELCHSILGQQNVHSEEITELLIRETEGNVFFVIDVLQALAYNLPRLDEIGHEQPLPKAVVAKGVMEAAMRRVKRLPLDMQPMMRVAAVMGREIDFKVLRHIDNELPYEDWLAAGVNAAILEYVDDRWRFQHDKLREGILHGLMEEERPRLHRLVAEAIENVYAEQIHDYLDALVYHWRMGGNIDKEAHYVIQAAQNLLQRGELSRARDLIKLTLERMDESPTRQRMELVRLYAEAKASDGSAIERIELYGQVMSMAQALGDRAMEMKALYDIGWMWLRRSQVDRARTYFQRSLDIARTENDEKMIAHNMNGLAAAIFETDRVQAEALFLDALRRYEAIQSDHDIALVNNNLSVLYLERGDFERTEQVLQKSIAAQERIGNRYTLAHAYLNFVRLEIVRKNWSAADDYLERAENHFVDIGYKIGLVNINIYKAWIYLHQSPPNPIKAAYLLSNALELAESFDNPSLVQRSLRLLPRAYLLLGRLPQAKNAIIRLDSINNQFLAHQQDGVLWVLLALGFYALAHGHHATVQDIICALEKHPHADFLLRWQLGELSAALNASSGMKISPCTEPKSVETLYQTLRRTYLS